MTQLKLDRFDLDSQCSNDAGSTAGGSPTPLSNVGGIHSDFEGLTLAEAIALVGKMHDEWDRRMEEIEIGSFRSSATIHQDGPLSLDSDASDDNDDENNQTPEGSPTQSSADGSAVNAKERGKAPLYDSRNPNKALLADLAAARAARKAAKEDTPNEASLLKGLGHRFQNVAADESAHQSIMSSIHPIYARNVFAGKNARQILGELPKDA